MWCNLIKGGSVKVLIFVLATVSFLFSAVDINSASVQDLLSIKGIGPAKAEAVMAYRKEHCFKNIEEIVNVKGFGSKFLETNKNNLTAGACKK